MGTKRALAERLRGLAGFPDPDVSLEQYPTPIDLAAHLVHLASLRDDVAGRTVVDLGAGTGVLALAAALRAPTRVVALERDPAALAVARENERRVDPPVAVDWVCADATRAPLCRTDPVTALLNPPFGAQRGNEGADRAFLRTAASLADVSYSIHNEGSRAFVESFAADNGGDVTDAFRAAFEMNRLYEHHEADRREIDVEVYRIEWD